MQTCRLMGMVVFVGIIILGAINCNDSTPKVINISAVAFSTRGNRAYGTDTTRPLTEFDIPVALGSANAGVFMGNGGRMYYANVPFAKTTGQVTKFTVHCRDNDMEVDLTVRLMAKPFTTTNTFEPPIIMAELKSSGSDDALQALRTTNIENQDFDLNSFYYYVELKAHTTLTQVVGVQIEYK